METIADKPVLLFENKDAWASWLDDNHQLSAGVWLRLAKKASGRQTVSYLDAIESALCYGWIDGQKKADDESCWLQKFTPRSRNSIWSKINRDKVLVLIDSGKMKVAGLNEVERAKADGRWDAAYESAGRTTIPEDFMAALTMSPQARAFFDVLDGKNRYAILFRIQTAKKADTRAKRIQQFIQMLEKQEKIHA